jgi:glycosyltransferase involved in cell wall biosynthesis
MKILVAAASFSSEISGIQRHALNMVRCLLRRPEISKVDLVVAPWQTKMVESAGYCPDGRVTTHVAEMNQSSLGRNLWYYRELPALAARLQPDVVHLSYPVPVDAASFDRPTVVTLHDLYPYEIPGNFRFPHVIFNRLVLRHCLRSVDAIACVSEATKLRLRQYAPHSTWQKAVLIYNCVEPEPHGAACPAIWDWKGEPFLLSVAQHRKNKNIGLLIRAFHRLLRRSEIDASTKLLIVGIDGPETQSIQQLISALDLSRSVLLLRGLSDPELQWCYARCEALVAPSKTEGFGLPVAEGLLVGCRIICSDIPAFREVGGPHCSYVTLGKGEEVALAAGIKATLQKPRVSPLSLPHLSAEALADRYVSLYRTLIPSEAQLPIADRDALAGGVTPERPLYDKLRSAESQSTRDERGYI